jgi:hypothetical protein
LMQMMNWLGHVTHSDLLTTSTTSQDWKSYDLHTHHPERKALR